jgi:hypothetical protein
MSADQFQQLMTAIQARPDERFRPEDLGYFDPGTDTILLVEASQGITTYRNVFSFTARVRLKAETNANLAENLDRCLKGEAEMWYTDEPSPADRARLKTGIDIWCSELEARFRCLSSTALNRLNEWRYTIENVQAGVFPETFFTGVIIHARNACPQMSEYAQILQAYRRLDPPLRASIPAPTATMRIPDFFKQLTAAKWNWYDAYGLDG